jgi:hypothetical protein
MEGGAMLEALFALLVAGGLFVGFWAVSRPRPIERTTRPENPTIPSVKFDPR